METLLSLVIILAATGFLVATILSGIRAQCRVTRTDHARDRQSGWRGYSRG